MNMVVVPTVKYIGNVETIPFASSAIPKMSALLNEIYKAIANSTIVGKTDEYPTEIP